MELSKFHIEYRPRMTIKAQTLAGFVAEFTYDAPEPESLPEMEAEQNPGQNLDEDLTKWKLFIDGSSN